MVGRLTFCLQPAEGKRHHDQRQGQQLQAKAGKAQGKQYGGGEAVKQPDQPVLEQGGNKEREGGEPQPEWCRVEINLIDEAIEQPGIGGQRQRQHELIPQIAALGEAVEAKGDGHQHGAHHESAVGIPGEL